MREVKFVNLTGHAVNVHSNLGKPGMHRILVIPPSGQIVKAPQRTTVVDRVLSGDHRISITQTHYDLPLRLPPPIPDTYYIVSAIVALRAGETRSDLLIPNGLVRDPKGVIIGCKSLSHV